MHIPISFCGGGRRIWRLACLALLGLYGFIILRGFVRSPDGDGLFCLIASASLVMQFGLQACIHMASSVNLIPTKGMTLPFISYGGSLASGLTIGLILALTRKRVGQN